MSCVSHKCFLAAKGPHSKNVTTICCALHVVITQSGPSVSSHVLKNVLNIIAGTKLALGDRSVELLVEKTQFGTRAAM